MRALRHTLPRRLDVLRRTRALRCAQLVLLGVLHVVRSVLWALGITRKVLPHETFVVWARSMTLLSHLNSVRVFALARVNTIWSVLVVQTPLALRLVADLALRFCLATAQIQQSALGTARDAGALVFEDRCGYLCAR